MSNGKRAQARSGSSAAHATTKPGTMSRRAWIGAAAAGVGAVALALVARDGPAPAASAAGSAGTMTVYKSPTCDCCRKWVEHVRENGFAVTVEDMGDVTPIKERYGVPRALTSCHTAVVGGYAIEGHVPADVIKKLLAERPAVAGLAVPGMPMGSPGMEGPRRDRYQVLTFTRAGETGVYAERA